MTPTNQIQEYKFFHELCSFPFVERIILYGSRARGDHQERSDIDLAFDCPSATDADWIKIAMSVNDADTLLKIDFVRYDKLSSNSDLKQNIDKEGAVLFSRK